jgi:hypothetical protein
MGDVIPARQRGKYMGYFGVVRSSPSPYLGEVENLERVALQTSRPTGRRDGPPSLTRLQPE